MRITSDIAEHPTVYAKSTWASILTEARLASFINELRLEPEGFAGPDQMDFSPRHMLRRAAGAGQG